MGAGVGVLQARVVRRHGISGFHWFASSAVGLALPFLAWDVAQAAGATWAYQLAGCVAAGGLAVGLWQAVLLRHQLDGPGWWLLGSALGWSLAGLLATVADLLIKGHAIRGVPGALLYLALVGLPGGILGGLTGWVLTGRWRATAD